MLTLTTDTKTDADNAKGNRGTAKLQLQWQLAATLHLTTVTRRLEM